MAIEPPGASVVGRGVVTRVVSDDGPQRAEQVAVVVVHFAATGFLLGSHPRVRGNDGRLPGRDRFVDLGAARQLPVGTTVDATHGTVTLIAAGGGVADFYGGIFRIGQTRRARPLTTLTLTDVLPRFGVAWPAIGNVLGILYLYFLSQTLFRYRLLDLNELVAIAHALDDAGDPHRNADGHHRTITQRPAGGG